MQTAEGTVFLTHPARLFRSLLPRRFSAFGQKRSGEKGAERSKASPRLRLRRLERRSGRTSALPYPPSR
jgi:hypothetical protein